MLPHCHRHCLTCSTYITSAICYLLHCAPSLSLSLSDLQHIFHQCYMLLTTLCASTWSNIFQSTEIIHGLSSVDITFIFSLFNTKSYLPLILCRRSTSSFKSCYDVTINTMSSAYLRLQIWRPPICSPPVYPSKVSLIIISPIILNKYGDSTHPCRTPFPTWNHSYNELQWV